MELLLQHLLVQVLAELQFLGFCGDVLVCVVYDRDGDAYGACGL